MSISLTAVTSDQHEASKTEKELKWISYINEQQIPLPAPALSMQPNLAADRSPLSHSQAQAPAIFFLPRCQSSLPLPCALGCSFYHPPLTVCPAWC